MGVQLTKLVHGREIELEELAGKRIAIDALNWIYQFISTIRQPDGEPLKDSAGNITSHLSGLFYRTMKLLETGIKPIYVFDGKPPQWKGKTQEQRRDVRLEAMREWKKALEEGDMESARKYAQRSTTVTGEILQESRELLAALGVAVVQAPNEGEALCSVIVQRRDASAVATQDYDSLLFGAPQLVRNLSITGKRKRGSSYVVVHPELITLKHVLEQLSITREQLIILSMLVGTDYNPGGIAGYGPKKSLELVKKKKSLEKVLEEVSWTFETPAEDIFGFFLHPEDADYSIAFSAVDEAAVKKLLVGTHDFSEERVDSALSKVQAVKGKDQKSLDSWFH